MIKQTRKSRNQLALADILEAFTKRRIWLLLGWQDIQMRYRRSILGPFWITLSMAITVYTMGLLYGHLFKIDLAQYYPYLAASMLSWSLISSILNESSNTFIEAEHFLKQMKLPYLTYILRVMTRNFIIFFHNIFVIVPIVILFRVNISLHTLIIFYSLAIIWVNGITYGITLAILGARFRDIAQLMNSLIQIIFFLTPIMWSPAILPQKYQFYIQLNPFAQFIELLRGPLLGVTPSLYALIFTLGITLIGVVISFLIFARYRSRIAYWV